MRQVSGIWFALTGFLLWGAFPLFWNLLRHVPAWEVLAHRIFWSFIAIIIYLGVKGQLGSITAALRDPKVRVLLFGSSLLIAANWGIFIWAVTHDRVLEASLGYYINPLMNVLLGVIILGESLRRGQKIAVLLATLACLVLVINIGQLPWVSLVLALTFALYALLRKVAAVNTLPGLAAETALLALPAFLVMLFWNGEGGGALRSGSSLTIGLLLLGGIVTTVPLALFTEGARRLPLSTIGLLQYISPTCQFFLGVFYFGERLDFIWLGAFCLIWVALAIYTFDLIRHSRRPAEALA